MKGTVSAHGYLVTHQDSAAATFCMYYPMWAHLKRHLYDADPSEQEHLNSPTLNQAQKAALCTVATW